MHVERRSGRHRHLALDPRQLRQAFLFLSSGAAAGVERRLSGCGDCRLHRCERCEERDRADGKQPGIEGQLPVSRPEQEGGDEAARQHCACGAGVDEDALQR